MSQVDNSGFRLMKAHSAYGVKRAVLFVFHPCAYDGHGDRISTLCYWVRITESRTGFMVSDAISTLDIRYWLMLRVRTDSFWEEQHFYQCVPGCQLRECNGFTLEADEVPRKHYVGSGVGENALSITDSHSFAVILIIANKHGRLSYCLADLG